MNENDYNDGWFLNLVLIAAGIGIVTMLIGIMFGVVWIVNHVSF